jgi:divalent metal cation (Fe/Co/Zn/Cd) transporter
VARTDLDVFAPTSGCIDECACRQPPTALATPTDAHLRRWAWALTALTIGWNSLEAAIAIVSGWLAGSIALVGFGLDSVVEVSSAAVIVWRLSRHSADHAANERAEKRAVRLIALSFLAIAVYVTYDSVTKLLGIGEKPEHSAVGLALVALSLIVMPSLAWAKRKVAAGLSSVALKADAAETQLCTYLSAVVLLGLVANSLLGWWWMDPVAGLLVAGLALKEGRDAWQNGDLCDC